MHYLQPLLPGTISPELTRALGIIEEQFAVQQAQLEKVVSQFAIEIDQGLKNYPKPRESVTFMLVLMPSIRPECSLPAKAYDTDLCTSSTYRRDGYLSSSRYVQ